MKKYELLQHDTVTTPNGTTLYRIRALKDLAFAKKGDLGGYIEKEDNLSRGGNAWVADNARVFGHARVSGNARVFGNAEVCGNALVYGSALVCENAMVYGDSWEKSPIYIQGSKFAITTSSHNEITIGCISHPIDHWLENYESIGKEHNFSEDEIEEYRSYIYCLDQVMKSYF
ncbi:MAG TPA: hypothetical protein VGA67_01180 [Candidatus Dojkabacteria bacterium]